MSSIYQAKIFFEDLVNASYKETGDMLESMQFMVVEKFLALAKKGYASAWH